MWWSGLFLDVSVCLGGYSALLALPRGRGFLAVPIRCWLQCSGQHTLMREPCDRLECSFLSRLGYSFVRGALLAGQMSGRRPTGVRVGVFTTQGCRRSSAVLSQVLGACNEAPHLLMTDVQFGTGETTAMSNQQDNKKKPTELVGLRPSTAQTQGLDDGDSTSGNLDKIRSILFGNQIRDFEGRFSKLDERLGKELTDLRDELRRRSDSLEGYVRQEIEALSARLTNEYSERTEAVKELAGNLENLNKAMEKRTRQLDEELSKSQRELRQQLLEQSKSFNEKLRSNHEELARVIEEEVAQLRSGKVDRAGLAKLLTDLAVRLNSGQS